MRISTFSINAHSIVLLACSFVLSVTLFNCSKEKKNSDNSSMKFRQYFVQGEKLYLKHCSNCHQKDGSGLGLLYPPLKSSDYMNQNPDSVLCLIRYGKAGPITVNGKVYDQPMPAADGLTHLEIAEIATYIYNAWGNEHGIISVTEASTVLNRCNQ